MKLKIVEGKNKKFYVGICDYPPVSETDKLIYRAIQMCCYRKQYMPFIKSFNKTIEYSYLVRDIMFPIQFWQDVKTQIDKIVKPGSEEYPEIINEEILYHNIDEDEFWEWLNTLNLPEKYNGIYTEKYEYQPKSVLGALKNRMSRIEVGTGGGKTLITYLFCRNIIEHKLYTYQANGDPRRILIVVPRKDLCIQLKSDFADYDSNRNEKINVETIFSGGIRSIDAQVTVGTYQSLCEYDQEYFDQFSTIILDEVHTGKSYSIINKIYSKCMYLERTFGMTGTMPDYQTLDYLHIVAMCGPLVYTKKTKDLMEDGNVVPVKIQIVRINYDEAKDYSKNLKEQGIVGTDKWRLEKTWFQENEKRNLLILKLIKNIPGNSIILVDTKSYIHLLYDYLSNECPEKQFGKIYGDIDTDERTRIKQLMEVNDNVVMIATYGTMSTGVSIKRVNNVFFVDGGKSEIRINQSIGRGLRLHPLKDHLNLFDFQDWMDGSSFKNQSKERNKVYMKAGFNNIKITEITI